MIPVDSVAREQAVNPLASVCVSAPAGSGKTGLLVRRFLALLARVSEPESVVAITFTRKAAAEMQTRVLTALKNAAEGLAASNPHEQALMDAAKAVHSHDRLQGWGLLDNPSRLRIQTIDSFCGYLTRQMPVLSGCGGQITATDDSRMLYRQAIESFLHRELSRPATEHVSDMETLLLHLDNNWESTIELLSKLLQRREQWQPVFGGGGLHEDDQHNLLEITQALVEFCLDRLSKRFAPFADELAELLAYREKHLGQGDGSVFDQQELGAWRAVADLCLTAKGEWRKTVTVKNGFPAGKGEAADKKQQMLALLAALREQGGAVLLGELQRVTLLPDGDDEPAHWNVLAALTRLLPRLGAELLLVFQQVGEVDHAQIAMAALAALGSDDQATDIALRLDHSLEHLLVDEFQDTSSVQYELIRRLTRGWQDHNVANPEAPRTLLVVGDAMQSIYGFREANVGLFIRARREGIGDLPLVALDLSVNFRSTQSLVQWTNDHFEAGFPAEDNPQLGAVQYRNASAARPLGAEPELALFTGEGAATAEIEALCDKLEVGVADETVSSIAILGRSRTQLRPVLAALRKRGIDVAARDLDTLAERPLIRDLLTLSTVLCDRCDRFAWLSLLRTPSLSLNNADLLWMATHCATAADLCDTGFIDAPQFASLSTEAQERVEHVARLLDWADQFRDRLALRVWIEESWLLLQGAACLENAADVRDAERFFQCLEQLEVEQKALSGRILADAVNSLFASPGDERCKVEVMTLHKAKGLEFDWVFVPALAKSTAGQDRELLLWDELVLPEAAPTFLLDIRNSAEAATRGGKPRLYDYLKAQAKQKREYEATRLFYVGCTRAADYLWLGASLSWDAAKEEHRAPPSGSLLSVLWPSIEASVNVTVCKEAPPNATTTAAGYLRLRDMPPMSVVPVTAKGQGVVLAQNYRARAFGTAIHRCLEGLVYRESLPPNCDADLASLLRVSLRGHTDEDSLDSLVDEGRAMLDRMLCDPWARWILSSQRSQRAAELSLTLVTDSDVQSLVLDYTFVDEVTGERWVVDYKTSTPNESESVDEFLLSQLKSYDLQLSAYAQALRERFDEPVRCALYFPAIARHAEWTPSC